MAIDSDEAFDHLLARLAAYPAYVDAHIGNIDDGLASGRTAAPDRLQADHRAARADGRQRRPTSRRSWRASARASTDAQREALRRPSSARRRAVHRALPRGRSGGGASRAGGDGRLGAARWRGGLRHGHPGLDDAAADGARAPRVRARAAGGHRSRSAGHRPRARPRRRGLAAPLPRDRTRRTS